MGPEPIAITDYRLAPTRVALETVQAIEDGYRVIAHQGGTRSGKTYGIQDVLIGLAYRTEYSISVTSISLPHLKKGAMRDWRELMEDKGDYDPGHHNMTDLLYTYPLGSYMEFFSVDDSKRVRGPGRDILHINEANLLSLDTWRQLALRTKKCIILDWNPAEEFHWIYDEVLNRDDCKFIQSTYLDNPFLSKAQRLEIERLKNVDPMFWRVYGLGERGTATNTIYHKFQLFNEWPDIDWCFGLDFGFTHPNALVKVGLDETNMFFEQMVYEAGLTTPQLIERIKPIVGRKYVYCDSSRPEIIRDLRNNHINAYPANKDVKDGIDFVRSNSIFVHRESIDFQKEMRSYKWKQTPSGQTIDEPVKAFDDLMDAARYGAISLKRRSTAPVVSFH
jgi:phage terminase large subunit